MRTHTRISIYNTTQAARNARDESSAHEDSIQTYLITPSLPEEQQVHRLSSDALQVHPPVAAGGGGRRQLRDLHLEGDEVGAVETSCPQAEMSSVLMSTTLRT